MPCRTWYAEEFGYEDPDAFWTAPEVIQAYKEHAAFIMSRRNTVTGVTYGNDPTIFSWNLINEGRCETTNCTAADIQVRILTAHTALHVLWCIRWPLTADIHYTARAVLHVLWRICWPSDADIH